MIANCKIQNFGLIFLLHIFLVLSQVNAEKVYFYGSINTIKGDEIEFFLGYKDKIKIDDELFITKGDKVIGRIKVIEVGEYTSVGKIIAKEASAKIDDTCIITNKAEEKSKSIVKPSQFISIKKPKKAKLEGKINVIYGNKVAINLGKKDGMEKDTVLIVKRGDKIIGKLKIVNVGNRNSIAQVIDPKEPVKRGDRITKEETKQE